MKTISPEKVVSYFKYLGLSKYEAKAYLALLRSNLSYGAEIQKLSGVPGPKIYETLASLVDKGLVYPTESNPIRYQPLPLENYLNTKKKEFDRVIDFLKSNEEILCQNKNSNWLWQLKGYENLLDKAQELIEEARKEVFVSLWNEEGLKLKEILEKAVDRGVNVVSIQMGEDKLPVGKAFSHVMHPIIYKVHESEFALTVDKVQGMFMVRNQFNEIEGYYSSNTGITRIIENYIKHDIYINRVVTDFGEVLAKKYGKNLEDLLI